MGSHQDTVQEVVFPRIRRNEYLTWRSRNESQDTLGARFVFPEEPSTSFSVESEFKWFDRQELRCIPRQVSPCTLHIKWAW